MIDTEEVVIMGQQGWVATGVIEASPQRVADVLLVAEEGPIGPRNAPLLGVLPGAGRFMNRASLRGGPTEFGLYYGSYRGGTVVVDAERGVFVFEGGFKFRAVYSFSPHPRGTLVTYEAINVAPVEHRERVGVRFQFWLGGKLKIGLRGGLRRMGRLLGCRAYPGQ